MVPPSGEQYRIEAEGYAAVVTESGGALRALSYDGQPLVDGFDKSAMSSGGRGQVLVPWPNRIRDGRYTFAGTEQQLALTEQKRHNASHGLVRWAAWSPVEQTPDRVVLGYRLPAQTGYPWTLDLTIAYALDADGLTVTQSATNRSGGAAPYASGAHPYLRAGEGPVDDWELEIAAQSYLRTDPERLLPISRGPIEEIMLDDDPDVIGGLVLNHAVTDLDRDTDGRAHVWLRSDRGAGPGVELWVDEHHRWLQLYTADDTSTPRVSLAVEPMTAPPDAFNSGDDLVVLEPGATFGASWGIRRLDARP
ncbi:aldose 1-epimerase family protein [Nocardioides maradonensis]